MLPKSFARVVEAAELLRGNIADVERSVIGVDHMVIGKRLAERWHLPAVIRECIWLHGQLPERSRHRASFRAADQSRHASPTMLVREQHLGLQRQLHVPDRREELLEAAGVCRRSGDVESACTCSSHRIEPAPAAMGLGQASTQELYQQALAEPTRNWGASAGQLEAEPPAGGAGQIL
jgi:hypothetical protein